MSFDVEQVMLSALNHYLFCPRRCALIHVEGIFHENVATLEGTFLHDRADTPGVENRAGVRIVHALPLYSKQLGLVGKADIVEFHKQPNKTETPLPVDYKRGARKKWDNDDVQLCAQALCLEEMTEAAVPKGAIFHAASRRRREVQFTEELRTLTLQTITEVRTLISTAHIPRAEFKPRCEGCSLRPICMPEIVSDPSLISRHTRNLFSVEG